MNVTINDLIEIQTKVKEAREQLGVITVKPDYVQVRSSDFDRLFGGFEYTIEQGCTRDVHFEKAVTIDGVKFICIKYLDNLTADEKERLGLEDDF